MEWFLPSKTVTWLMTWNGPFSAYFERFRIEMDEGVSSLLQPLQTMLLLGVSESMMRLGAKGVPEMREVWEQFSLMPSTWIQGQFPCPSPADGCQPSSICARVTPS